MGRGLRGSPDRVGSRREADAQREEGREDVSEAVVEEGGRAAARHVELRAVGALEHAQLDVLGQNAGEQPLGEERVFVQKLRTRTSSTKKAGERERRSRV